MDKLTHKGEGGKLLPTPSPLLPKKRGRGEYNGIVSSLFGEGDKGDEVTIYCCSIYREIL
jgi:hypothetical protein